MRNKVLAIILSLFFISAQATPVDLELSLVIDISGSVNLNEYNLQMQGYSEAFQSNAVQSAILNTGVNGSIAVNTIMFATNSIEVLPFTLLDSIASINSFADELINLSRPSNSVFIADGIGNSLLGPLTNIAGAIDKATESFGDETGNASNAFESDRQVIDVSIDGIHNVDINTGVQVTQPGSTVTFLESQQFLTSSRDNSIAQGVDAINVVTIGNQFSGFSPNAYASNYIVAGDNGFTIPANNFGDFANAIETKLAAEISGKPINSVPEPSALLLLLIGLLPLALRKKLM